MESFNHLLDGLGFALSWHSLLWALVGVTLGTLVGILPGIGPALTVALLLPVTLKMEPSLAFIMFAGIYYGAMYGSSTTSILLNTPGETGSIITAIEGNLMARKGRGASALATAAIGSFIAGLIGTVLIALVAPQVIRLTLLFGPAEYFALMVLAFTTVTAVLGSSMLRGLASLAIGLCLGLVGIDLLTGQARFVLGFPELLDGIDVVVVAIGLFAVGEAFYMASRSDLAQERPIAIQGQPLAPGRAERIRSWANALLAIGALVTGLALAWWAIFYGTVVEVALGDAAACIFTAGEECGVARAAGGLPYNPIAFWAGVALIFVGTVLRLTFSPERGSLLMSGEDLRRSWKPWLRGTALGFPMGALPAGGTEIPTFMSYVLERRLAKRPEEFGKGAIEGVAGPEAANNAAVAGVLVPLLTLGLPTSATAAIMLAAFQQYGLQPGALLFQNSPDLVWGLIASLLIGNVMLLVLNLPLVGLWVRLLAIPRPLLYGGILVFATLGTYSLSRSVFDLILLYVLGVVGFLARRFDFPLAPAIIGLILGPLAEQQFRRALSISQGHAEVFLTQPISAGLLAVALVALVGPWLLRWRAARRRAARPL